MNAYLVMLHHTCDDVPIYLTQWHAIASHVANRLSWDVPNQVAKAMDTDACTPVSISIVTIEDGKPINREVVRTLEGESSSIGGEPF